MTVRKNAAFGVALAVLLFWHGPVPFLFGSVSLKTQGFTSRVGQSDQKSSKTKSGKRDENGNGNGNGDGNGNGNGNGNNNGDDNGNDDGNGQSGDDGNNQGGNNGNNSGGNNGSNSGDNQGNDSDKSVPDEVVVQVNDPASISAVATRHGLSVLEQQRGEFMQTASPRLPFVSRLRRHVVVTVYAGRSERIGICLGIAAKASAAAALAVAGVNFAAAVADEHEFDLLFEGVHVGDVRCSDAATTENTDVGELFEVG